MAWPTEMTTVLRVMINDLDTPQTYTDQRLQQVLAVCAQIVTVEMNFSQPFQADVVAVSITPDPTDTVNGTRDNSFINLVCLKAACLTDRGKASLAAGQAVNVKDGTSSVDLRGVAQARLALLQKGGWCGAYEDEKFAYLAGQVRTAGAAILSPFRIYAGFNAIGAYFPVEDRGPSYNPF